jgi:hypothetical protein
LLRDILNIPTTNNNKHVGGKTKAEQMQPDPEADAIPVIVHETHCSLGSLSV